MIYSTGSLSLVRTILNYQNVTNDPTCRHALEDKADYSTNTLKGLSIPNWYWRTWEVFFGVVAACIPTLRPLYKWVIGEYTRLTSKNTSKPTTQQWTAPPPSAAAPSKTFGTKTEASTMSASTPEEDMLPLQNFDGAGMFDNVEREVKEHSAQARGEKTRREEMEFKPGLHIHGDLSMSRPGHFKRWDSEARIGGGHGVEEVEDRI